MANNIVIARVSIVGTRPLLFHKFGPESMPLEKQEKAGVAGNDPTEWRRSALITPEGQLYIEPSYLFGCLREAGKFTKKKLGTLQKVIGATLQVLETRVLLDRYFPGWPCNLPFDIKTVDAPSEDITQPVYMDIRGVTNPSTRSKNIRYRITCAPGWHASFCIAFDKTVVSRSEMEAVTRDAGNLVGIGSGRAIGFGRFEVESFEAE